MNITILGKDVTATEAIKDYVNKKMDRIEKYFGENFDVSLTLRTERNEQIAEMTVKTPADTYRAVTAHNDLYASISIAGNVVTIPAIIISDIPFPIPLFVI